MNVIFTTKHYHKIQEKRRAWRKKNTFGKKICVQGSKWQMVVVAFVGSEVLFFTVCLEESSSDDL